MTESKHDFVKTNLLIEGLQDCVPVANVHRAISVASPLMRHLCRRGSARRYT